MTQADKLKKDLDEALDAFYKEFHDNSKLLTRIAELEKELQELREALENLVQFKRWKDKHGKDEHYVRNVDAAWQKAFDIFPMPATPATVDTSAAIHPSTKNLHQ